MLIDIATSLPPYKVNQTKAATELKKRMADRPAVERLIDTAAYYSGIETRYLVIPDGDDMAQNKFYSNAFSPIKPGTKSRMDEYEKWSKELTCSAVGSLLKQTKADPQEIKRLVTISCTGFFAPGLDYHLMKTFNLPPSAKRTNIGFMGCAASITGFNTIFEAMNSLKDGSEMTALMVSVELCSLHLQTEPTRDNILSNIIFADGCAAVLFSNSEKHKPKLDLIGTQTVLFENSERFMGWRIGNYGFEMILSQELPKIIIEYAVPALLNVLKAVGLDKDSVSHWALHPGGRAILDALQTGLKLQDELMVPSRYVLKNHGNMSSASILYVLKYILDNDNIKKDDIVCAVAFGPGLTMEVAFFKGV